MFTKRPMSDKQSFREINEEDKGWSKEASKEWDF